MDTEPTTRRWFQVRLSTIFSLTAIAAWGMATWPWVIPPKPLPPGVMCCSPRPHKLNRAALVPASALLALATMKGPALLTFATSIYRGVNTNAVRWLSWSLIVGGLTVLGLFRLIGWL
jgi:hypothetical protein